MGIYEAGDIPSDQVEEGSGVNREETIAPVMNILSKFRDDVKAKANEGPKELFMLSDKLRDNVLPNEGILIEDRKPGESATWKFVDKEILLKELAEKEAKKQAKI
jgi:hypothetical protein